ncbi:hypothetical protein KAR28_00845 [Candidatus Parcubacteria bacterium]|nr:hypothetical protein [Candidatus Parcubacteria bacterium]
MKKVDFKEISWRTKACMVFLSLFLLILLTGCGEKSGKMVKFEKPDIKDSFCGPIMDYRYCKCAFHNEFCDDLGISSNTANTYVRNEYDRWVAHLLKQFESDCKAGQGIFHPKDKCEYCQHPYIKQGNECVDPDKKEEDEEEIGFKLDGPFDSNCNPTSEFETGWKKYSHIDARIPLETRSWEAQGVARAHEKILSLKVENFKLERDMEIDRQIRLEARAYKDALAKNIKQNLIKATIRLIYTTYKTLESGYNAGRSFETFLTGTETLARTGGILSAVKAVVPKGSKIEIDTSTITGKVLNVGIETAYQAMESLGDPKDVVIKFMKETKKVTVPSADITPEEINILRNQHITMQFVDHAIAGSYKDNAKKRAQIIENENKIAQLEAEVVAWEEQEKNRVKDMLRQACLKQKKSYEEN